MRRELGLVLVYKQPSDIFQCRCLQHIYQEEFVVGVDRIFDGGGEGVLQTASTWLLDRPVWFDSMGSVVFLRALKIFSRQEKNFRGFSPGLCASLARPSTMRLSSEIVANSSFNRGLILVYVLCAAVNSKLRTVKVNQSSALPCRQSSNW